MQIDCSGNKIFVCCNRRNDIFNKKNFFRCIKQVLMYFVYFAEQQISTTTEFNDYTDGDASSTKVEIPTTTESYLLTILPSDDVKGNE